MLFVVGNRSLGRISSHRSKLLFRFAGLGDRVTLTTKHRRRFGVSHLVASSEPPRHGLGTARLDVASPRLTR